MSGVSAGWTGLVVAALIWGLVIPHVQHVTVAVGTLCLAGLVYVAWVGTRESADR